LESAEIAPHMHDYKRGEYVLVEKIDKKFNLRDFLIQKTEMLSFEDRFNAQKALIEFFQNSII
jgi:hypothetical protein